MLTGVESHGARASIDGMIAASLSRRPRPRVAGMEMARNGHNGHNQSQLNWLDGVERRVRDSIFLPRLTVAEGQWLARALPRLQQKARPEPGAVRVEDVALRYRSGRLGIADAMDATAELLQAFAAAGADLERRGDWYISDEDEDDDEDEDERPARLCDEPEHDLLVSARIVVDAAADDAGSAALHWVALALTK